MLHIPATSIPAICLTPKNVAGIFVAGILCNRARILVLCQFLIMGFDVAVHGGEKVAARSAIIAFGSRSEPRRSGEATPIPKVAKALE
jgi:hypothetical protein